LACAPAGIQIEHDGIKLLADASQQRNGQAFVKLMSITDLKKALCRNKQFYEERNIVVTQSTEAEFAAAANVYTFGPSNGASRGQVAKRAPVQASPAHLAAADAEGKEKGTLLCGVHDKVAHFE
jgi:hypothetical protein